MEGTSTLAHSRTDPKPPRSLHFALFAIGLLWLLASRVGAANAAQGIARLLRADVLQPLLERIFQIILLLTGFTALNWLAARNGSIRLTNALAFRPTAPQEWQKGLALGWALVVAAVLPMVLAGDLHPQFDSTARAWGMACLVLLTAFVGAFATEIAFRGFLFRRLIAATGPVVATLVLSVVYAFTSTSALNGTPFSFAVAFFGGVLFSLAYLRTHALWLGAGLHFGWLASMGILFGLPVAGSAELATLVSTESSGRVWFTGGAYGPEGALFTAFVLLAGMGLLYVLTRDYAWAYTHPLIVAGGYPMDVPPPAAHVAMEAAAPPPPLVQIGGVSSVAARPAQHAQPPGTL